MYFGVNVTVVVTEFGDTDFETASRASLENKDDETMPFEGRHFFLSRLAGSSLHEKSKKFQNRRDDDVVCTCDDGR